jgi:hypothetical protein
VDEKGSNALAPQRIDKKMHAPHQERRLLGITPPRIAPFVKLGNDFRDRALFCGVKDAIDALLALPDATR